MLHQFEVKLNLGALRRYCISLRSKLNLGAVAWGNSGVGKSPLSYIWALKIQFPVQQTSAITLCAQYQLLAGFGRHWLTLDSIILFIKTNAWPWTLTLDLISFVLYQIAPHLQCQELEESPRSQTPKPKHSYMYITLVVVSAGNVVVKEFLELRRMRQDGEASGRYSAVDGCSVLCPKWKLTGGSMEGSWEEGSHLTLSCILTIQCWVRTSLFIKWDRHSMT